MISLQLDLLDATLKNFRLFAASFTLLKFIIVMFLMVIDIELKAKSF